MPSDFTYTWDLNSVSEHNTETNSQAPDGGAGGREGEGTKTHRPAVTSLGAAGWPRNTVAGTVTTACGARRGRGFLGRSLPTLAV